MDVQLEPDDQIVPAGKRIGLMIFSSERDFNAVPQPGNAADRRSDATSLQIPVVGGSAAFKAATGGR